MKKKLDIKKVETKEIEVCINSNSHTIEEIKKEIKECFFESEKQFSQVPVYDFWPDE